MFGKKRLIGYIIFAVSAFIGGLAVNMIEKGAIEDCGMVPIGKNGFFDIYAREDK